MSENKKPIVFAIFGDEKFISWTYGMFTQLVKHPKLYGNSQDQINTCNSNFDSKLKRYYENKPVEELVDNVDIIDKKLTGSGALKLFDTISNISTPRDILDDYSKFSFKCFEIDLDYGKHNDWKYPTHEEFDEALAKIDLDNPINTHIYDR